MINKLLSCSARLRGFKWWLFYLSDLGKYLPHWKRVFALMNQMKCVFNINVKIIYSFFSCILLNLRKTKTFWKINWKHKFGSYTVRYCSLVSCFTAYKSTAKETWLFIGIDFLDHKIINYLKNVFAVWRLYPILSITDFILKGEILFDYTVWKD